MSLDHINGCTRVSQVVDDVAGERIPLAHMLVALDYAGEGEVLI